MRVCTAIILIVFTNYIFVHLLDNSVLTLILLTWRIWWAPNNTSKWQMGFNSAFRGLTSWTIYQSVRRNSPRRLKYLETVTKVRLGSPSYLHLAILILHPLLPFPALALAMRLGGALPITSHRSLATFHPAFHLIPLTSGVENNFLSGGGWVH